MRRSEHATFFSFYRVFEIESSFLPRCVAYGPTCVILTCIKRLMRVKYVAYLPYSYYTLHLLDKILQLAANLPLDVALLLEPLRRRQLVQKGLVLQAVVELLVELLLVGN